VNSLQARAFPTQLMMMMMMLHYSYAAYLEHDEIMYSPVPFTVRPDLDQSADGTR
jgi:hypothetical protein